MNKFEDRRGATVERFVESLEVKFHQSEVWLAPWATDALREFFRAEEDERLGRWRWPEDPNVVVYRDGDPSRRSVTIFFEKTGGIVIGMAEEFLAATPDDGYASRKAARAFFAAHPEPKPWWDAGVDEAWELTANGDRTVRNEAHACGTIHFVAGNGTELIAESSDITAGRRIWPESTDA